MSNAVPCSPCPSAGATSLRPLDQPDNGNEDDRAYGCGDDRSDQPANRNAKDAEQPTADFGADNANDDVAKEAVSATHNQPGEPAGDCTDQKKDNETRERHLTCRPMARLWMGRRCPEHSHTTVSLSPTAARDYLRVIGCVTEMGRWSCSGQP